MAFVAMCVDRGPRAPGYLKSQPAAAIPALRCELCSDPSTEAAHEKHDQGNYKDETDDASANYGTAEIKAAATEKQQKHN